MEYIVSWDMLCNYFFNSNEYFKISSFILLVNYEFDAAVKIISIIKN